MTAAATLLAAVALHAEFVGVEIQRVPLARLLRNLEAQLRAQPKDVQLHYALARVHSMAYASKAERFDVDRQGRPFFGNDPHSVSQPARVTPASVPEQEAAARRHLAKAVDEYRAVLAIDPRHTLSRLGLAWCLDQTGEKDAALAAYRIALEQAWAKDRTADQLYAGYSVTEEIAGYLLKLLDPEKDAAEIERLRGYQKALREKPRWITPILVPLEDAPLAQLVAPTARVAFDLDGSGSPRRWGWIAPNAAWLVFDYDGRGRVTSGLQMAGGVAFWIFWDNGYRALASLDDDGNGILEAGELDGLALWRDANGDGVSDPGEVVPVPAWGITALSCRYRRHATGIPFSPDGVRLRDGTTRPSYDWIVRSGESLPRR